MKKKKIIFLVDHKHRDFPSIALIGYFLEKKGHKVFFKRIHEPEVDIINPDVIVEAKYSRPQTYINKIEKWQKKNIRVVVMETEGIIQWKGFVPLMNYKPDFCFFWNENHGYAYDKEFYKDKIAVLGCPRSDFLHKNFKKLSSRNILLKDLNLNTNRKIVTLATPNSYEDLPEEKLLNIKKRYYEVHKSRTTFETLLSHMIESRKSIKNFCLEFSKSKINCILIIKPHPNENINFWLNFINNLNDDRIKVMIGKTIQELLSISDLHIAKTGCLTLPEAALSNINSIEILSTNNFAKEIFYSDHMKLGTYNVQNFIEIKDEFEDIVNGNIPLKTKEKHEILINRYIDKFFKFHDGRRCFEYAKVFQGYLETESNFQKKSFFLINIHSFLYSILIKFLKKNYRLLKNGNNKLIDNRGRFDNRISESDKKKLFSKFDKLEYVQNLINK